MQEIYTEFIRKVFQNKDKLEKELEVKITNQGKNLFIDGEPDKEFIALQAVRAINLGFSTEKALLLKKENSKMISARPLSVISPKDHF